MRTLSAVVALFLFSVTGLVAQQSPKRIFLSAKSNITTAEVAEGFSQYCSNIALHQAVQIDHGPVLVPKERVFPGRKPPQTQSMPRQAMQLTAGKASLGTSSPSQALMQLRSRGASQHRRFNSLQPK